MGYKICEDPNFVRSLRRSGEGNEMQMNLASAGVEAGL